MTVRELAAVLAAAVAFVACASADVAIVAPDPSFDPTGRWDLVIADEFDGSEIDASRWNLCHWWAEPDGCQISTSNELQWYRPEQVTVSDGALHLAAAARSFDGHPYVSGMVSSGPKEYQSAANEAFTYGAVEARVWLPAGAGIWPAVWMLPESTESRPEIDLLELYGQEPSLLRVNYHWIDADGERADDGERIATDPLTGAWHTIGLLWEPGLLVWYLDGVEQWRVEGDSVSDEPMYTIFNLAVGGDRAGPPGPAVDFPVEMRVDWYRVWQR